jgi:2-dehydropantoate 2-reductase
MRILCIGRLTRTEPRAYGQQREIKYTTSKIGRGIPSNHASAYPVLFAMQPAIAARVPEYRARMIAIFGAGAIGCWVGGKLAAGGADVTLIGRARVMSELANGVTVSELGRPGTTAARVTATTDASAAAHAAIVLVTVKSAQTAEAGAQLASVVPEGAIVASLQNGVRNADALRAALPGRRVLAGMVPFNVIRRAAGAYHRASQGILMVDDDPAAEVLVAACRAAHLPIEPRRDMLAVQWAKLVMNLNNAINALSGQPLATELGQRPFRRCLAAAQREALELLAAAGIAVAKLTAVPPRWMPSLLALPDGVFRVIAKRVVAIDPEARSSMWDDFEAKRPTEIDYLQGEVVALGERLRRDAPVNRKLVALVRAAEAGGKRDFTAPELHAALTS